MTTLSVRRRPQSYLRALVIVAAYLCAFVALDLVSHQFRESSGIVAWYPPAGLTYALLLVFGVGYTPAVTIALCISSVFVYRMPQSVPLVLLWALVISSTYGGAAAFVRRRTGFDWHLRRLRDVTDLISTAVLVSALLAILSVTSSALTSNMPRDEVLRSMLIWWIGETVGTLTVTPFLLIHVMPWLKRFAGGEPIRSPVPKPLVRPRLSVIGQTLSIAFLFYLVFGFPGIGEFRPMYLITLPLIWIALDHGLNGATTAIVVLNLGVMLAMWFSRLDLAHLGEVQLLMIVNCIVGLPMGAVVTERKTLERSLRESEEYARTVLESINTGVVLIDPESHVIVDANRAAIAMLHATKESILGAVCHKFICPAERGKCPVSDLGQTVNSSQRVLVTAAGDTIPIIKSVFSVTLRDRKYLLETFVDITSRVRAETEKESIQAQLRQSQKMEAVGTLAGGVAHDFNNLLTGILGNIALMRTSLSPSDPLLENLDGAETAARQAADLTKGLLTFGRSAVVLPVPMKITDALEATLVLLKQSLPATMRVVRDYEQTAWDVLLDQSQMTQILLNLAVNARDAMMGKGTLTIRTRNGSVGEEYVQSHPFARTGEFVHLSVMDTGPGIPPAILEHLFEPFHTTKPVGSGTGLGLSIVYGAVKQTGGWITAVSTGGVGTTFDIYLPRCLDQPGKGAAPEPTAMNVGSGTVLVVEDEPVVSAVTQALLKRSGYVVLMAGDGESALHELQEHRGCIDLILLDMTMPGMATDEIVQAIRTLDSGVPILLTSGYTSSDTVKRMLKAGSVQGFLPKPYEMDQLLPTIAQLLRRE